MRINAQLQNDSFDDKKEKKIDQNTGKILRSGYAEGTLSEIEVSKKDEWTSNEILERSGDLVEFMQKRWNIKIRDEDCEKIKKPNSLLKKCLKILKIKNTTSQCQI